MRETYWVALIGTDSKTVATAAAVPQLSRRTNQILAAVQAIQETRTLAEQVG